jgi:adenylyltransferase/sulfurtransferase
MLNISVQEFEKILRDESGNPDIDFINVCTPAEYQAEHIAGVRNVPLDTLFGAVDELRTKKTVYVHCRSGRRSAKAIETLQSLGVHADLVNVDGGLIVWSQHQASKSATEKSGAAPGKLQKTPLMVLLVPAIISFIIITLVALLFLRH